MYKYKGLFYLQIKRAETRTFNFERSIAILINNQTKYFQCIFNAFLIFENIRVYHKPTLSNTSILVIL